MSWLNKFQARQQLAKRNCYQLYSVNVGPFFFLPVNNSPQQGERSAEIILIQLEKYFSMSCEAALECRPDSSQ